MVSSTLCPTMEALQRLANGQAVAAEAAGLRQHLGECQACRETTDLLKKVGHILQNPLTQVEGGHALDPDRPPLDGATRIMVPQQAELPTATDGTLIPSKLVARPHHQRPVVLAQPEEPLPLVPTPPSRKVGLARSPYPFLQPAETPEELGRLGGYRVLEWLGGGAMGMVFRVEDPRLQRHVAMKVMQPDVAADPASRERFLREARAAAALEENDHVVTIHQVGEANGVPYLVMPLLQGETLEDRLARDKKLPVLKVLAIGREIALGLAAAHAKGLIHRDIKPANLWLEAGRDRVKILDFGLARPMQCDRRLTLQGLVMGTPAFMSPEQAKGELVDHRTDLFSLGCVLYQVCTGELPFDGDSLLTTLQAVVSETPPDPRTYETEIPPELAGLIMQMLAKDPAQRPPTAQAVAQALRAIAKRYAAHKDSEMFPCLFAPPAPLPKEPPVPPAPGLSRETVLQAAVITATALAGGLIGYLIAFGNPW